MDKEKIFDIFPKEDNIPERYNLKPVISDRYLLDGRLEKFNGRFQKVYSPVMVKGKNSHLSQRYIGEYPLMDQKLAFQALQSSITAYDMGRGEWPQKTPEERIGCVLKFVEEMKKKREEIVNIMMWEIGKTLSDCEKEFDRTVTYILDTVEALKELDRNSSKFLISEGVYSIVKRSPLGVTLCMGPYNYPLNETFTTLIPALIMGNTVIFKPPKFGVLLHFPLLEAFKKAFPPGVVNTIYGDGKEIITPIMKSGKIDVLAFIGSSVVADTLKHLHPKPHRLKCVLGLDAKNAAIILEDADIDIALKECISGCLSYNGQRCTAIKIIFVHEKFQNIFIEKFIREIENLKFGMPWEKDVKLTPLPDISRVEYLKGLVKDAEAKGAKVINENGGLSTGTFFYPAVLYPVKENMRIYYEEQFGPVVPFTYFNDIKQPLEYIVKSNYGQQVSIFSKDPKRISKLTDILVNQVSRVNLNSQCQRGPDILPFTGRKDSAEGTLSVSDALRVFSIRSLFAFKDTDYNKKIVKKILKGRKSKFISTDFIM
ncbi:MAG: NADP-dependent glyceraldehyde-3-phosphate dehydrogenase [Elusimicrobiota bacterium]